MASIIPTGYGVGRWESSSQVGGEGVRRIRCGDGVLQRTSRVQIAKDGEGEVGLAALRPRFSPFVAQRPTPRRVLRTSDWQMLATLAVHLGMAEKVRRGLNKKIPFRALSRNREPISRPHFLVALQSSCYCTCLFAKYSNKSPWNHTSHIHFPR